VPAGAAEPDDDEVGRRFAAGDEQALPLDALFRRDGPPRLTLVTCGGPFLPEVGGYRDNVVVVAEPVS
jgi:hypothetical protein